MVRSKGSVKKVGTLPYREYMELRSMSRRPPPSYTEVEGQRPVDPQNNPALRRQNGFHKVQADGDNNVPTIIVRSGCSLYARCRYIVYSIGLVSMFLLCVILISVFFPYPMHASCTVKWRFGSPCTYTMQNFRSQIIAWSSCMNCRPRGGRCLYTLMTPKAEDNNVIRAMHLAPNLKILETIKIDFHEVNKTCLATGESVSNEWFRIFDYGANYCNLHNLVTAIGFDQSPKFLELTGNAVCTQYNMAVCE